MGCPRMGCVWTYPGFLYQYAGLVHFFFNIPWVIATRTVRYVQWGDCSGPYDHLSRPMIARKIPRVAFKTEHIRINVFKKPHGYDLGMTCNLRSVVNATRGGHHAEASLERQFIRD